MIFLIKNTFLALFYITVIGLFLGCESNLKEIRKNNLSEFIPNTEADALNLKYTDSGSIKAVLVSDKMLEYATIPFPFTEFPKGVHLTAYDNELRKTIIKSNYAVLYKNTGILDLIGNVRIITDQGYFLETEQLYYDRKNMWFFTEKKFKFTSNKGISTGQGIDFSKDFKIMQTQKITGELDSTE